MVSHVFCYTYLFHCKYVLVYGRNCLLVVYDCMAIMPFFEEKKRIIIRNPSKIPFHFFSLEICYQVILFVFQCFDNDPFSTATWNQILLKLQLKVLKDLRKKIVI